MRRLVKKERKQVGPIYHFTSVESLFRILDSDTLKGHIDKFGYAISFSRNKELWYKDQPVRIEINGDLLSDNFKIEPFNFFPEDGPKGPRNESEERIWLDQINSIKQYITNITVSRRRTQGIRSDYVINKLQNKFYLMPDVADYISQNYGINVEVID